ncbi:hypothetical protein C942_03390 [Photobacterium marinum]|uniref:Integrase n=1 Tax=Photobacterium marinum TaxID=1056511 RepID=L8J4P6_9GAMM|nr:hypothetical protein [Photobacterium marinum]ELR63721.1 hypothetical protein C942_03390 [Photobacterium marinum]
MTTLKQVADKIFDSTKPSSGDRRAAIAFQDYLSLTGKNDVLASEFGEFQFIEFIQHLTSQKSTKAKYAISVAVRRLLGKEHKNEVVFPTNPSKWPTPQKPDAEHFEPLSTEELEILNSFIKKHIDLAYHKEEVFKESLTKGVVNKKIGTDFWRRENPDPSLKRFSKWKGNLRDTIATLYSGHPEFPNNTTDDMQKVGGKYHIPRNLAYTALKNPITTVMKRLSVQNINTFTPFMTDAPNLILADVLTYIYPDILELAAIKIAICLETAWSPDIVERIDPNDFIYDPIPIDGNWVFIKAPKEKGAAINTNTNIREQRIMIHPSSKSNTHSAYNLIKLLVKRTSRLRHGSLYDKAVKEINGYPSFVSLTTNAGIKIVAQHPERGDINRGAQNKQVQKELGYKLDLRQLRPTRLYLNEKEHKLPLLLQVALFGHSSSAITDEVYKGNAHFQQIRKDKLAVELNAICESIGDGSFKGKLIPLRRKTSIKKKILNIFTNQNGESPLAICNDPFSPDWQLSDEIGARPSPMPCKQFNKCLICSQSSVTNDNIPFVVDRYLYLDQIRRSIRAAQFDSIYRDEYEAAKEVVESWPYQEEISEAELRNAIDGYLLPPVISECN